MSPLTTGVLLALAAAASFGITTPLVQRFGADIGPFTTATTTVTTTTTTMRASLRGRPTPIRTPISRVSTDTRTARTFTTSITGDQR